MDLVELQYATMMSSRLENFKITHRNPTKINFRCPLCGDSEKSKRKSRGWLLEDQKTQVFHYFCHNCGASMPFFKFLRTIDPNTYNDYITAKYVDHYRNKSANTTEMVFEKPVFDYKINHLSKIKKMSQLSADHPAKLYIEKRQIPSSKHYRLYYAPKFMTWINMIIPNKFEKIQKDEPRLILPLFDENKNLFGVSARSFDPKGLRYISIMFDETKKKIFGLDEVNFKKTYMIVEGALDSLFLSNAIAMVGADASTSSLQHLENAIVVFDNEPRNKEIHRRMEKIINAGLKICIWPSHIREKDINDMFLNGVKDIEKIITDNTFSGLQATLQLTTWRKT